MDPLSSVDLVDERQGVAGSCLGVEASSDARTEIQGGQGLAFGRKMPRGHFGGQRSIQLSYGCLADAEESPRRKSAAGRPIPHFIADAFAGINGEMEMQFFKGRGHRVEPVGCALASGACVPELSSPQFECDGFNHFAGSPQLWLGRCRLGCLMAMEALAIAAEPGTGR